MLIHILQLLNVQCKLINSLRKNSCCNPLVPGLFFYFCFAAWNKKDVVKIDMTLKLFFSVKSSILRRVKFALYKLQGYMQQIKMLQIFNWEIVPGNC